MTPSMLEYKVFVYRENIFSSLVFGSAKVDPVRFTEFLNRHGRQGWRVVTLERETRRVFLFFAREAFIGILERPVPAGGAA